MPPQQKTESTALSLESNYFRVSSTALRLPVSKSCALSVEHDEYKKTDTSDDKVTTIML